MTNTIFETKLTCVLPCILIEKAHETNAWRERVNVDATSRLTLFLSSFLSKFNQDDLLEFLIVCPVDECIVIKGILSTLTLSEKYKVVAEQDLIPDLKKFNNEKLGTAGWYIQQAIKLAAHKIVKTKHYIVFDSDVICVKNCSYRDFILHNLPVLNIETDMDFNRIYNPDFARHELATKRSRYNKSNELLGYPMPAKPLTRFLGETPVLLDTQCVGDMLSQLEFHHQRHWVDVLADHKGWTEYGLYFSFMDAQGLLEKNHSLVSCNFMLDLERSVWQPTSAYGAPRQYDRHHFINGNGESGFFIVVQSWINSEEWLPDHYKTKQNFYHEMSIWIA